MKPENCYWDIHRSRLVGTPLHKIRECLKEKLIVKSIQDDKGRTTHPERDGIFYLKPTKGRFQIHTVDLHLKTCTCQHGGMYTVGKESHPCSHWDAVQIFLERQENGEETYDEFKY